MMNRTVAILLALALACSAVGYLLYCRQEDCAESRYPVFLDRSQYKSFDRLVAEFGQPSQVESLGGAQLAHSSLAKGRIGTKRLEEVAKGVASTPGAKVTVYLWRNRCHFPFDGGELLAIVAADGSVLYLSTQMSWT